MIRHENNPTATSFVIGRRLRLVAEPGRLAPMARAATMPAILLAFAGYLVTGIVTMRVPANEEFPGPGFFPALIAAGLAMLAALLLWEAWRSRPSVEADGEPTAKGAQGPRDAALLDGAESGLVESGGVESGGAQRPRTSAVDGSASVRIDWRSLAWIVVPFLAFALLLELLGWIVAAALLFASVARGFGERSWTRVLFAGITASAVIYIAFDMMLGMSLPSGVLGEWS